MKRIAMKYRHSLSTLLVGWMVLCGLMPAMSVQAGDSGMAHAAHHQMDMAGHHGHHDGGTVDAHCCEALQADQLPVSYPFMDLFSFVIVGCLLLLLAAILPVPAGPAYIPAPHSGPPIHKRHCVWLD